MRGSRGAVLVMATFFALFLVGLVYHAAGVGGAALEQQVVQDAADSVALSAATAKARGMNIIALVNLVMAAVLAILVALRVLQAVLVVAIAIVGVACIVTQGAACGAMQPLGNAYHRVSDLADELEPRIKEVLQGLADASQTVNRVVPILAEAEAVYIATRDQYDPTDIGFAWPATEELPTKEGSFEELCARAAENVVYMCSLILPGDLPEVASEAVGEVVSGVAAPFSEYFCGGSDSPPPDEMTQERAYPLTDHVECDSAAARPDADDGSCGTAACAQCAAWGCATCLDRQEDGDFRRGQWTRRIEEWVERDDGEGHVARLDERPVVRELVWLESDPCDGDGHCADDPICAVEEREDAGDAYPDGAERVTRRAYERLHGCLIEESIPVELQGEPLNPDEWPKPRVLDEEKLPAALRVDGYVLAGTARGERARRIAVAGGDPGAAAPGRIAFAAAQFLSPEMDLWHMTWRSRLVRFRFGDGGLAAGCGGPFAAECGQVGEAADGFAGSGGLAAAGLGDYLVH